jgi:hypothetical protein
MPGGRSIDSGAQFVQFRLCSHGRGSKGQRSRTHYRADFNARWLDESFEIKLRNHKTEAVEVRIVEQLYRWTNWDILKNSDAFKRLDSKTVEFLLQNPSGRRKDVSLQSPLKLVIGLLC